MAKLGYTWYPKDWGNSESVFELNLSERGLYREFIDLSMLSDNKTEIKKDVWIRKFCVSKEDLDSILDKLIALNLIEFRGNILFIPSCESRLNLVRGGSNGGKKSKPISKPNGKPTSKPFESLSEKNSKPTSKQIEREKEIEIKKENYKEKNLIFLHQENGIDVFFEPKWQIQFTLDEDGSRIYGNLKDRMCGGLSEFGIQQHCENRRIKYVK